MARRIGWPGLVLGALAAACGPDVPGIVSLDAAPLDAPAPVDDDATPPPDAAEPPADAPVSADLCGNGQDDDQNGIIDDGCPCTPGEMQACFSGPLDARGRGICADGVQTCDGAPEFADWGPCVGETLPAVEVCNDIDDDCSGLPDDAISCGIGACGGGGGSSCSTTLVPAPAAISSGCRLDFPPASTLPCTVPSSGPSYYLDAVLGSDANTGTAPDQAWGTLCYALAALPDGATLEVAEGTYANESVTIDRPIIVKGGWDPTFTTWDPDAHQSVFLGRLTLDHSGAVWGGFRMLGGARPGGDGFFHNSYHTLAAGTLLRNYIQVSYAAHPDTLYLYGIIASSCDGNFSRIQCNDIYVTATGSSLWHVDGIEYGNLALHAGGGEAHANRVCVDGATYSGYALAGYGTCGPATTPATVIATNNILDNANLNGQALEFYSCGGLEMDIVLTNNTFLAGGDGIGGYGGPPNVRWKLTNNIVFTESGGGTCIDTGGEITSSEHNLCFGFATNTISPAPLVTAGDDTSGTATVSSVFVNVPGGDFHPAAGGEAIGTGLNVHADPGYGWVTHDLGQSPRPATGDWDRGAYQP